MNGVFRVRDLMTADVVTLNRNDKLTIADDLMNLGRIRHLPVVDEDGEIAGIVSQRDLFRGALSKVLGYGTHAQQRLLSGIAVKEVMETKVVTAKPSDPVSKAAERMLDHKIGCLIVVEKNRIVGILTESDFVGLMVPPTDE